jgi:hypothetical protein
MKSFLGISNKFTRIRKVQLKENLPRVNICILKLRNSGQENPGKIYAHILYTFDVDMKLNINK